MSIAISSREKIALVYFLFHFASKYNQGVRKKVKSREKKREVEGESE